MREVKFRVWDSTPTYEFMTTIISLEEIQKGFNVTGKYRHVMQYTGLKDKNGVEIFEGDILEFQAIHDSIRDSEKHNIPVEWNDDGYWNHRGEELTEGKVIGNIYRNPELLT